YPGADHSRYSHSLGVMETARKIIDQLRRNFYISDEQETTCLAAALLHDLGHGPFSHVFERVTGIDHEELTHRVVLDPDSEVHRVLIAHDATLPQEIIDFLECSPKRSFICDILSSQLDADRLDYLLRDNLMTGSRYGGYDLRWLLVSMTIDTTSDRLAVTWKGVSAVEAYLAARYHMYRNVYFHKVVRAGEGMLKLALQRAKRLAAQDRLEWPRREDNFHKALLGQKLTIKEFVDLDDISVMHCFKLWTESSDATLASLCKGILNRRIFKTIDLSRIAPDRAAAMAQAADTAITAAGGESGYEMFYDEITDTPYEIYVPTANDAASEILVCDPDGKATEFASISPMSQALNTELAFRRIHVASQWKTEVDRAISPIQ
ncbi:MAG TPA: HD domain-containing protein, partial [Tepidisphaeraceae bacterium]|nr:HD domain-containing protein [Tepidisphaeraceae bacterium]